MRRVMLIGSRRRGRCDGGQALTEFALVAPIFFLLLFGVIQLAMLMGGQNGLAASARELARYAAPFRVATDADASAVCANADDPDRGLTQQLDGFMRSRLIGYIPANTTSRIATYSWHPNADGTYYVQLEIHITYKHQLYVPLVSNLIDGFDGTSDDKFELDALETMRIENLGISTDYNDVSCNV